MATKVVTALKLDFLWVNIKPWMPLYKKNLFDKQELIISVIIFQNFHDLYIWF